MNKGKDVNDNAEVNQGETRKQAEPRIVTSDGRAALFCI